jgi:tRNA uridine 5-carboxymethylaminomethyl modification enzyme
MVRDSIYDAIVVGGGHAGIEAALAVARAGFHALLVTMKADAVGQMSCNPAIGGQAKGQITREIDALGGEMAKAIDTTGIQFRMLNRSKGPAMWSPRAQADKKRYSQYMKFIIEDTPRLDLIAGETAELVIESGTVKGVKNSDGKTFYGRHVILTAGTFLNGLIHIGDQKTPAGRRGEKEAQYLSSNIEKNGIKLERFKTGTPPRIHKDSIDYSVLTEQPGDPSPTPFSYQTEKIDRPQLPCYIAHTNEKTHEIIRDNLGLSALYGGQIKGTGPRYCPSIEDKVVKFSDKKSHQLFLEPEGADVDEVYINGLSMSLPEHIQIQLVRTIKGLEKSELLQPAYAIEYDYSPPTQIKMTLETKVIKNLFFAGQINGTSGYEEAGIQGLVAAYNVIRKLRNEAPFILDRSEAYGGVLIDDLVTRGTNEPYRMFTSRAEFRLLLRQDNADERLMKYGHEIGLIPGGVYLKTKKKYEEAKKETERLKSVYFQNNPLAVIIRRQNGSYSDIPEELMNKNISKEVVDIAELNVKYEGYIKRQESEIKKFKRMEHFRLPSGFDYKSVTGITREAKDKLSHFQPASVGQASRIPGITACDLSVLVIHLDKAARQSKQSS